MNSDFYLEDNINYQNLFKAVENQASKGLIAVGALITSAARQNVRNNVLRTATGQYYNDALKSYGELRNSITFKIVGNTVIIFTNVEYAVYQEYGTGRYVDPKINYKGRQSGWFFTVKDSSGKDITIFTFGNYPHPFLRPALFNNTQKAIALIKTYLSRLRTV